MGGDPYANLTDVEVLARAREALSEATALPLGSIERAVKWMVYDSAKAELDLRLAHHVLAKFAARGE